MNRKIRVTREVREYADIDLELSDEDLLDKDKMLDLVWDACHNTDVFGEKETVYFDYEIED